MHGNAILGSMYGLGYLETQISKKIFFLAPYAQVRHKRFTEVIKQDSKVVMWPTHPLFTSENQIQIQGLSWKIDAGRVVELCKVAE